jgi:3,4-dihydroxy 2-butanone 4-phosphate synthase / GTP cyclohydrolase II
VRHSTGIVCAPMPGQRLDALRLPPMVAENTEAHATAFTVSVDHVSTGTGVSATDRVRTLHALVDPATTADQLRRPGHVFPLRYREGGVLERAGHTEAAVDLLRLAGLPDVGVISEIVGASGEMAKGAELAAFARRHDLPVVAIADLVRYRGATESLVEPVGRASLPTRYGRFTAIAYRSRLDGIEHLALVMGDVTAPEEDRGGVLVRVHSECLTGDVVGSLRCDCGTQFDAAMRQIAAEGAGVLVYLRGHEGRGIGLGLKLRAYVLQERGLDTVAANTALGLPVDSRDYGVGARILADLGLHRIRLITNNPEKYREMADHGLEIVERVPQRTVATAENIAYLRAKRDRMGHLLELTEDTAAAPGLAAQDDGTALTSRVSLLGAHEPEGASP